MRNFYEVQDSPRDRFALFVEGDATDAGGGGEKKEEPKSSFVPSDEFKAFQATITDGFRGLTESMRALAADRAARKDDAPAEVEITPEKYAEAVATGGPDSIPIIAAYERQREARYRKATNDRVSGLETTGLGALEAIAKNQAKGLAGALFTRFEKEIEQHMRGLDPSLRAQPDAWINVFNLVKGTHYDELVNEEREKVLRGNERPPAGEPGKGAGREVAGGEKKGDVPTPRDLGGDDAVAALVGAGKDEEGMARRMGYKSWADYMEKTREYR